MCTLPSCLFLKYHNERGSIVNYDEEICSKTKKVNEICSKTRKGIESRRETKTPKRRRYWKIQRENTVLKLEEGESLNFTSPTSTSALSNLGMKTLQSS